MYSRSVTTDAGEIAYTESGDGPVALFVHGVFLNSGLWDGVVAEVADLRRCIAVDLPAHGRTKAVAKLDYSLNGMAAVLAQVCDALDLGQVDLVANDTGGAVAQVFAAQNLERLRTLTLTNCDCHDNLPPANFAGVVALAQSGDLAPLVMQMAADPDLARGPVGLGVGYEHPEALSDEKVAAYLAPVGGNEAAAFELQRCIAELNAADLLAAEPALMKLDAPGLVVWGTADDFFDVSWAYWLRDTIPGVEEVVELEGAKLFFPDERASELAAVLRRFWARHP